METFDTLRPYLFSIAYRMLGSVMESEDMLQEAWIRWDRADQTTVRNPKAFLAKTMTRLCLDHLKSAKIKREHYVGEWLPEPLVTAQSASLGRSESPDQTLELAESLSFAFLHLLERLTPAERAVFLLREVFDYDYPAIAEILEKNESACRQLLRRGKAAVEKDRPKFDTTTAEHEQILGQFMTACISGSFEGLLNLLADDVVEYSDGGGVRRAALKPIVGADKVVRFLLGITKQLGSNVVPSMTHANGRPAILLYEHGEPHSLIILQIEEGKITQIFSQLNPHKLIQLNSG